MTFIRARRRFGGAALAAAALTVTAPARTAAAAARSDNAEGKRLHAFFDAEWERAARDDPEAATYRGDHRYGDRLNDQSAAAIAAREEADRAALQTLRRLKRELLVPADRLSYDVCAYELEQRIRFQAFKGYNSLSLGSDGGFHTELADLLDASPKSRPAEVEQMLARLAAFPLRVGQEIALMRDGMALGWVPARPVLDRVIQQIDAQLPADPARGPFYAPFAQLPASVAPAEQETLRAAARSAIAGHVVPAMKRLRAFVIDEYGTQAPPDGALSRYPGGREVYAAVVEQQTTTRMSAAEIHELGLQQVALLRGEIDAAMRDARFPGDFRAFIRYLGGDPKFAFASGDALLRGYRDIAKRIDPELPRLFAELPRTPYGVREMPAHLGAGKAEYYSEPALDGSRAGWFNANTLAFRARPSWTMETLVAHEAVPGHHLQTARAAELKDLPAFRRAAGYAAYSEGWALYAETLGRELGLYTDPYSRFGHLQSLIFRAARLVVDTGLHAQGWSRQRAIDYMIETVGEDPDYIAAEVDRYYSTPAQALAYMIGQQRIVSLRERARQRLGERYDIRRFHQAVLDQGALPLDVLERVIDDWLAGAATA
ncbi:MAG: DUF885 domain-containing protein [Proteobacteria bacterium]|nr:DUF885 domain-containing protein [Pseudomonadota bacterium]